MKKKNSFRWNVVTILGVALILASCFLLATLRVNQIATKSCYRTLNETTMQIASDVQREVACDREELNVMASVLATHQEITGIEAEQHLRTFREKSIFTAVGILLPEEPLRFIGDTASNPELSLSFQTESAKVPYISGVCHMGTQANQNYIYEAVPIVSENTICGILYGFVDLETFSRSFTISAMSGQCDLYIIDGDTGDFIVDT